MKARTQLPRILVLSSTIMTLAACSGGGGGDPTTLNVSDDSTTLDASAGVTTSPDDTTGSIGDTGDTTSPDAGTGDTTNPDDGTGDTTNPDDGTGDTTNPDDGTGDTTNPDDGTGDTTNPDDGTGDTTNPDDGTGDTTNPDDGTGDTTNPDDGTDTDTGDQTSGTIDLGITDAPIDTASNVYVQFAGVKIQPATGDSAITFTFDTPKDIDLLALQGGLQAWLLEGQQIPSGDYDWIRLMVNASADSVFDSYIVINDEQYELSVPAGSEKGLQLNTTFTVEPGTTTQLTIDFDLRKSVNQPTGQTYDDTPVYTLKPTLRLVTRETGGITGIVDPNIFTGLDCSAPEFGYAVYIYSGTVTPDDIDGIDPDPIKSVKAQYVEDSYHYSVASLEPGDYTVAATCQADLDDPATDDLNDTIQDVTFVGTDTVSVSADSNTVHDFQ